MSPEQFTGKDIDARSDIYSIAVIAYEMLAGHLPFSASDAVGVGHQAHDGRATSRSP